jgi:hypothetical protein
MNNLLRLIIVGVLLAFALLMIGVGIDRNTTGLLASVHLPLLAIAIVLSVLPTVLAVYWNCRATIWIDLMNFFFGELAARRRYRETYVELAGLI